MACSIRSDTFLAQLYRWEEAGSRVAVALHTLDVNIAIMHRTPELEQDISARTMMMLAQQSGIG
jgi:hypothetical protein